MHVVGAVQAGVVNEALPARHGPRFLEVHPHDDEQVRCQAQGEVTQPGAVLQGRLRIVDRARPDDHQQPVVYVVEHRADVDPGLLDVLGQAVVQRKLVQQRGRRE